MLAGLIGLIFYLDIVKYVLKYSYIKSSNRTNQNPKYVLKGFVNITTF